MVYGETNGVTGNLEAKRAPTRALLKFCADKKITKYIIHPV